MSEPDKLYYDVSISNLDTEDFVPPVINFNEIRNIPFLNDPSKYYMSIIRFSIDTGASLPVFIPEIVNGTTDINETIYKITMVYNNTAHSQTVMWSPQNKIAALPLPPSSCANGEADLSTGYYYCYNYQYFLDLVNNAFEACIEQFGGASTSIPPIFTFDSQNKVFILNCPYPYYNSNEANPIKIFLNPPLYQLFGSLPFTIEKQNLTLGINNKQNIQLQVGTFGGANVVEFPLNPPIGEPQYQVVQCFQEYSTLSQWTPCTAIVFTSSTLPIVSNQVSAPLIYIDGQTQTFSSNNSNICPIITDLVSSDGQYNPNLVYNPTAEYRLIELIGTKPLYNLDIQVYFRDRHSRLYPLRLPAGGVATLKFLFTKKK
jgi:hypothetical protein